MWKNINHLINKKSKSTNISSLQIDDQVVIESSACQIYLMNILPTLDQLYQAKFRKLMSALKCT